MGDAMDAETDALVWKLHRELNDLRPRAGRAGAAALTTQLSMERARRARTKQQGTTESGSREHSRRRRSSDGGDQQHTSAHIKREPRESSSSGGPHPHPAPEPEPEPDRDLSDAGPERPAKRGRPPAVVQHQLTPAELRALPPLAQAAVAASEGARRRARVSAAGPRGAHGKGERQVKLFLAGMRWAVSLPCSSLRSRLELARAVNEAFAGEILSVGRGDGLCVVFVSGDGEADEMPALRGGGGGVGGGGRRSESASKWRRLSKQAARVYVRWHDAAAPPGGGLGPAALGGGEAQRQQQQQQRGAQRREEAPPGGGQAACPARALPLPHEELD
ncbi:hypothetical protein Rsub_07889 [Raphidocelis subcapitata]|uniref:Uncharacterized protein n=1 Tax=Raphidocelis subcapitata TaxID=307507 RepID=A0A2V0P5Q1_9CHLO|nr:hypothetical protein Rsub_07889 [Raphidocelis subcapitata]|eukprot:GBF95176.1 hypothetical protein Rsub_07889 [Raphidocelis subcapitata]